MRSANVAILLRKTGSARLPFLQKVSPVHAAPDADVHATASIQRQAVNPSEVDNCITGTASLWLVWPSLGTGVSTPAMVCRLMATMTSGGVHTRYFIWPYME